MVSNVQAITSRSCELQILSKSLLVTVLNGDSKELLSTIQCRFLRCGSGFPGTKGVSVSTAAFAQNPASNAALTRAVSPGGLFDNLSRPYLSTKSGTGPGPSSMVRSVLERAKSVKCSGRGTLDSSSKPITNWASGVAGGVSGAGWAVCAAWAACNVLVRAWVAIVNRLISSVNDSIALSLMQVSRGPRPSPQLRWGRREFSRSLGLMEGWCKA